MVILRFQSRYFQLRNETPVFRKRFSFSRNYMKVKVLKTFKTSSDCHSRSFKRRAILEIPRTVFRRTYAFSVGFNPFMTEADII